MRRIGLFPSPGTLRTQLWVFSLTPILTRHVYIELVLFVTICLIIPSLYPKEVCPCVPSLCISDVQGAAVVPGVPKEVESALLFGLHFPILVVGGHWWILEFIGSFLKPVAVSRC